MKIGIDATNIRGGGGVTHLVELLQAADPHRHASNEVLVWACRETLDRLPDCPWLTKLWDKKFEDNFVARALWQKNKLACDLRQTGCEILFVPGGSYVTDFHPVVTMSQNMLPFEWREMARYGVSLSTFKFLLLRLSQGRSFRKASGVIFLTKYAKDVVTKSIGRMRGEVSIIPHGIDSRFFLSKKVNDYRSSEIAGSHLKLLYVSPIDVYKHHKNIALSVVSLRAAGHNITIDFVGGQLPKPTKALKKLLATIDPTGEAVRLVGLVDHGELHKLYHETDGFVYGSSCENLPIILLEAMASGLPIACSNMGPMPEVLGDAGIYFNPLDPVSIEAAIEELVASPEKRVKICAEAKRRAEEYSWDRCAADTFAFLKCVLDKHSKD